MAEDKDNGKKRPLTRAEKFKNYCIGLGALSALILGLWANLKGEPTAEKAWETSEKQLNKNREAINKLGDGLRKLHLMFVHLQGQSEGYNNAKLIAKIEKLEKENERLQQNKSVVPSPKPQAAGGVGGVGPTRALVEVLRGKKVGERKLKPCHPGWVRVEGRCTKNRAKIAKAVNDARSETREARRKMLREKAKREAAERAKVQAQRIQLPAPKPMPKLAPMPKNLDEASKKKY
jgi:hypothetical protein